MRAMFSWIQWHSKMKIIQKITSKHLNEGRIQQQKDIAVFSAFMNWKKTTSIVADQEREQIMTYTALQFRITTLCKKALKVWKYKFRLSQVIPQAEKKLTSAILGFSFFCIKTNYKTKILNEEYLQHKYQAEKLQNRLAIMFRRRKLFNSWKEIAMMKRVYFPSDYYHTKLAKKVMNLFSILLRKRWIKQRNNIVCDAFTEKRLDQNRKQVFIILYKNVLLSRREQYNNSLVQDFRKEFLISKAFQAIKTSKENLYKGQQIINYQTEDIQDFDTRDVYSEKKLNIQQRKIDYDINN